MDRELSHKEQSKGKYKILGYIILGGIILYASFFLIQKLLVTKADSKELIFATVELGEVKNTLTASGLIVPTYEREINAPVATEIKKVFFDRGSAVKEGDLIIELDQEFTKLEYDQLNDELSLRKNNIEKLKLQYDKDLRDLDYRDQIKGIQLEEFQAELQDQQRLLEFGGATAEEVEKAALNLRVAKLEKKMLENDLSFARSVNDNEKLSLELEYQIQEKRLKELRRKLRETSVQAPQNGVITWINKDLGKTVLAGETLVKFADLGNYAIECTSSDRNAQKIKLGLPAEIKVNKTTLTGVVDRILPTVENNTIKFYIKLDEQDLDALRPNMRTEVFILTDYKESVLRVRNGPALKSSVKPEIFVVNGNEAIKRKIEKGISNNEYVEVKGNIKAGDRIIISDSEDYLKLDKFMINSNNQ